MGVVAGLGLLCVEFRCSRGVFVVGGVVFVFVGVFGGFWFAFWVGVFFGFFLLVGVLCGFFVFCCLVLSDYAALIRPTILIKRSLPG